MATEGSQEAARIAITDNHRKVVFAFMKMIRYLDVEDADGVEVVTEILSRTFKVDSAGFGGQFDTDLDLAALVEKESGKDNDEKFNAFLELIKKKGYFNGAEEGTEAYSARMAKARAKFAERNNPYDGLSADQLKQKGNELVGQTKYKEAIGYYTRAIELAPSNHILFANRAAAHTHLKDYKSAIIDCERCIALDETYAKAYSRLGTALFYEGNYRRAVDAYTKATELEPANESHKQQLAQAQEKAKEMSPVAGPGSMMPPMPGMGGFPGFPGMPGMAGLAGMPGMPPGFDFNQMAQMMNNPQFMGMATQMMQNPEFSGMVSNMAKQMGHANPNPEELTKFMDSMRTGQREVDEEGNLRTPFGVVNREALEQLQEDEVKKNPKFVAIMEDVRINGPGAFQKYIGDPEVAELMQKFTGLMRPPQ